MDAWVQKLSIVRAKLLLRNAGLAPYRPQMLGRSGFVKPIFHRNKDFAAA